MQIVPATAAEGLFVMRRFPHSHCPPADELVAYESGKADPEFSANIEAHVQTCPDCARSLASLRTEDSSASDALQDYLARGFLSYVSLRAPERSESVRKHLSEQRNRVAHALADPRPRPEVGQIWAVELESRPGTRQARALDEHVEDDSLASRDMASFALLVLVLDQFVSASDGGQMVNLTPVTEDERLAAEWSLIFRSADSGIGGSAVIHVDMERSGHASCLNRCIGRLPTRSGEELLRVERAWSRSEAPPSDLVVGRLGHAEIRTRPEWQLLGARLSSYMDAVCRGDFSENTLEDSKIDDGPTNFATSPTGEIGEPQAATQTNPWLDWNPSCRSSGRVSRPAASLPDRVEDATPLRRVAEQKAVYGKDRAQADASEAHRVTSNFAEEIREFLQCKHDNRLEHWSKTNHQCLVGGQLAPFEEYSIVALWETDWRATFLAREPGLTQAERNAIFSLACDVYYFCIQESGKLKGEILDKRAARHEFPPLPSDSDSNQECPDDVSHENENL